MSSKPIFLNVSSDDTLFVWQQDAFLDNNVKLGYDNETHVILFKPADRQEWNQKFFDLQEKYKEYSNIKFFFYEDTDNLLQTIRSIGYIPLLRPYCLKKHFNKYPELSKEVIFYHDCDILFTKKFDFSPYMQDDTCYLSNTVGYLGYDYWIGKMDQAIPEKVEQLKEINPIGKLAEALGISLDIMKENDGGVGGAQYLLKNIDAEFWDDVMRACITARPYLLMLNKEFFTSEAAGWQSWTADMIAVLWNLWKRGQKTATPKEFDFAWGTDLIERLQEVFIYHNAGISATQMELHGKMETVFYKGKYAPKNESPHNDIAYLKSVSPKYCNGWYAQKLLEVKNPII